MGKVQRWITQVALKHESDLCLLWVFSTRKGYPASSVNKQSTNATRLICAMVHGSPPSNRHQAAHSCGQRMCVNPKHLYWATYLENESDKVAHGTAPKGELNPAAKLDQWKVDEIRRLRGLRNAKDIAQEAGVHYSTIYRIWNNETWGRNQIHRTAL